jgi:colicin import membrane protein
MPFDPTKDSAADPLVSRPRRIPTPLMTAGVAGACLLGAGLGLWARPTSLENGMAASRPAAAAPARPPAPQQIEIRVDRPPPPVVGPAAEAAPAPADDAAPAAAPSPEPSAPKQRPDGLLKVRAVVPAQLADEEPPEPVAEAKPAKETSKSAAAVARKKAEAARDAREEAELAARKRRLEKARVAAAESATREKAREKAERRIAERKAAERVAEKAAEKKAAVRLAEKKAVARRAAEKKLAAAEKKKAQFAAQKAARPAASPTPTVKVVKAGQRCAAGDPGAALACSDPALGAADRRLARAYREAEDAGVPSERLERQQRRWLQARANAARQAPWAVHDVYLARIAELEDQAREAEREDY